MPKGKRADGLMRRVPSELLRDMRAVYKQPPAEDSTEGEKTCRLLLLESPKEFLAQLGRLEAAHRAGEKGGSSSPGNSEGGVPEKPDERERFLDELTERLLREAQE